MKKLMVFLFAISTMVLGCNPKMNSAYSEKPQTFNVHQELVAAQEDFSYQFTEGACDTGKHEFTDHTELCRALNDDSFNNFCAREQRRDYYEQECR